MVKRSPPVLDLTVRTLTPQLFPALVELFGPSGARGCWCLYWRIGAAYRQRPAKANREAFQQVVENEPSPGLLAFSGDLPVGWCQLTPRASVPQLDRTWRLRRVDETPVWSISCLYVRLGYRRRGITAALIQAAIETARTAGAPALEAYPLDAKLTPSASSTGFLSTYLRAGFKVVARHTAPRPIVRYTFRKQSPPRTASL